MITELLSDSDEFRIIKDKKIFGKIVLTCVFVQFFNSDYLCLLCKNVNLLARHMQFPAKVQKSYAVLKMIISARLVQKCFETSILCIGEPHASLEQELRSRETANDEPTNIFLYF